MQEIDYTANPFPGLRPFESNETHLFFGRDGQSEELLRRLKRTRFLAVVGTSGSGKSSLVRAGLLPALQGGLMASAGSDWRIAILRPGGDPIGNLARVLASSAVLGSSDEKSADMQAVMAETTLRRSSLGLVELVTRARTKLNDNGQPLFPDYENLLVVVDQFEELFRFKQLIEEANSKEDAAAFVKLLLEAVGQRAEKIYVVLTMRSDFLGDCSQFWELPEAINKGQYLIPRMTRDERREAISGPIAVGQGTISEPLVNQLLNDVGDNPDQLPILQHALMRTWDYWLSNRRNGNPIDIPDYNAIGGMAEALSRHADEAHAELNASQQAIAEKLFKGLTEKGTDNREIRRPMEVGEICELTGADEAAVIAVIEVFRREGRSFLMPPPTDALTGARLQLERASLVDISHESLIRNWDRLKTWVDEESHSARIYRRLAETAMLHRAGEEALLMDPALQGALDWREKNKPNAVWARRYHPEFETAMSYLDASVAARDAETQERERRRRKEVDYKRTKLAASLFFFSFLLSLTASVYAYKRLVLAQGAQAGAEKALLDASAEREQAKHERDQATAQSGIAEKDKNDATRKKDEAERARTEAERLAEIAHASEIRANESRTLAEMERRRAEADAKMANAELVKKSDLLYAAYISFVQQAYEAGDLEQGRELALLAAHDRSPGFEWDYLWNLLHSEKETLTAPDKGLINVITSPNGGIRAVGAGRKVELTNLTTGEKKIIKIKEDQFSIGSLAISRDLEILAVGDASSSPLTTVKLYDTTLLKEIASLKEGDAADVANAIVFTPDRHMLIIGGDGSVRFWDWESSAKPQKISLAGTINLAISPDGNTLALTSADPQRHTFPIVLWDMSKNEKAGEILGHSDTVTSVAFTSDGKWLFSGSLDRTVKMWDVVQRKKQFSMGFASKVFSLALSPDDNLLAVGYGDGTIKVCKAIENPDCATLRGHHETLINLAFSAAGKFLFSSDSKLSYNGEDGSFSFDENASDTAIKSWDVATLIREQTPIPHLRGQDILTFGYTPDSKSLAIIGGDDSITLLDAETNELRFRLETDLNTVRSIALSPDGKLIATAYPSAALWDASTGKQIGKPLPHSEQEIAEIAFSPDSRQLATVTLGGTVRVWDTASQELVAKLRSEGNYNEDLIRSSVGVAFSPDGKKLALLYGDVLELWDWALRKQLRQFKPDPEQHPFRTLAFSPTGEVLAIGFSDGSMVVLLDSDTFNVVAKLKTGATSSLAFSPNGKILVTGGDDGTLRLWDWASSSELITLRGHSSKIRSIVFSPDGRQLATSYLKTLRVWHAPDPGISLERKPAGP